MTRPQVRLIVIRSANVERLVAFYRLLGFDFQEEQHGTGPRHFAAALGDAVFEIYPLEPDQSADTATRLGFCVANLHQTLDLLRAQQPQSPELRESPWGLRAVVRDPDGRAVELYEAAEAKSAEVVAEQGLDEKFADVIRQVLLRPELYVGSRAEPVALESVLWILFWTWTQASGRHDEYWKTIEQNCVEQGENRSALERFRLRYPDATDEQATEYVLAHWRQIAAALGILSEQKATEGTKEE